MSARSRARTSETPRADRGRRESRRGVPEVDYELHDVIAHNGYVAVRATMHACHGETGQEGEIDGIAILRFDGDRIAEEWSSWDYLALADQLGLSEGA